ncbi:MAG: polysaccharide biosynthesis C-terminal domain-containing protein, partial [Spirochaetota bacterium]
FLNNCASFVFIRRHAGFSFSKIEILRHIRPLLYIAVMTNGWLLYGSLDKIFLGSYSTMEQVAFYGAASKIIDILFPFLMALVTVTAPRLSWYLGQSRELYDSLVKKIASLALFVMIPAAAGIFLLSDEIIFLLGGAEFAGASLALKILSLDLVILAVERLLTHNVLFIFRKERLLNIIIIGFGCVNAGAKYLMKDHLTAVNALAVMVAVHFCLTAVQYVYASRTLAVKLDIFCRRNLFYLAVSLLFIPAVYEVKYFIPGTALSAAVCVIVCGCIYAGILLAARDENLMLLVKKGRELLRI